MAIINIFYNAKVKGVTCSALTENYNLNLIPAAIWSFIVSFKFSHLAQSFTVLLFLLSFSETLLKTHLLSTKQQTGKVGK